MSNGHHKYSAQWWRERFNPPPPIVNFDRNKAHLEDQDYTEIRRIIEAHTGFDPADVRSARVSQESGYVVISMRVYVKDHDGKKFIDPAKIATNEVATKLEIVAVDYSEFIKCAIDG